MTNLDKVREEIFDLITDPPCRHCDFWDVQGHYCWLKNMHPSSKKCELMNQILNIKVDDKTTLRRLIEDELLAQSWEATHPPDFGDDPRDF